MLPRPPVGGLIISNPFGIVVAGFFFGKGMHSISIVNHLPVGAAILHFLLEGLNVFLRYMGVICTVEYQYFGLYIAIRP